MRSDIILYCYTTQYMGMERNIYRNTYTYTSARSILMKTLCKLLGGEIDSCNVLKEFTAINGVREVA